MRFVLPVLAVALGCTPPPDGPQDLGPAVVGVYLGNDTDLAGFLNLRAGKGVVIAAETGLSGIDADDPIAGAAVSVGVPGSTVTAAAVSPGLYETDSADAFDLYAPPGSVASVAVDDGDVLAVEAPLPPILVLTLGGDGPHPAGEPLVVRLPDGWTDDYDQVLAQVLDGDGVVEGDDVGEFDGDCVGEFDGDGVGD